MHPRCPSLRLILLLWFAAALLAGPAGAVGVGDKAPVFTLNDLDGYTYSLDRLGTHPVLLVFLDCQAAVSIALAPQVQSDFYLRYGSQGVGLIVLGLECAGCDTDGLSHFRYETGVEFPLLLDAGAVQTQYDMPMDSLVLIDASGMVRYVSKGPGLGAYHPSDLRTAVEQALREASNAKTATWGMIKKLYQ